MPGIAVGFNTNTVLEGGTAADLSNGVLVLAKDLFDRTTHAVKATWIEIVRDDAKQPRVSGPVGDFVSASDFRVGGQKVDASQATLVDGE